MKEFTKKLKEYDRKAGLDLLGIAPISRFKGIAKENHPASIFPEVKSVVVIGKRIARGALRGVEEGTQFFNYSLYGYTWLEDRFLSLPTVKVAEFLAHLSI